MEHQTRAQWDAETAADRILQEIDNRGFTAEYEIDVKSLKDTIVNILLETYKGKTLVEVFEEEEKAMIKEEEKTFDDYFNEQKCKSNVKSWEDFYGNPTREPESLNDVIDDYFCCEKHNPQHEIT